MHKLNIVRLKPTLLRPGVVVVRGNETLSFSSTIKKIKFRSGFAKPKRGAKHTAEHKEP